MGKNGWYKSAIQVTAAASDATSGVASFEVSADGAAYQTYTPISFSDGAHTIQFRAVDAAGNVTETALQTFSVDTLAPTVNLPASWKLGTNVPYDVIDEGSGLGALRIVIEDEDEKFKKVAWDQNVSGRSYSQDIDWNGQFKDKTVAPPGTYLVWLKASDLAGNERFQLGKVIVPEPNVFLNLLPTEAPAVSAVTPEPPAELLEMDSVTDSRTGSDSVTGFGGETTQPGETTKQAVILATGSAGAAATTTTSGILWDAAAVAAISAATAYALDATRKRKEAEEEQAARVRAEIAQSKAERAEKQQKQKENYAKQKALQHAIDAYHAQKARDEARQQREDRRAERKDEQVQEQLTAYTAKPQDWKPAYDKYMAEKAAQKNAEKLAGLPGFSSERQDVVHNPRPPKPKGLPGVDIAAYIVNKVSDFSANTINKVNQKLEETKQWVQTKYEEAKETVKQKWENTTQWAKTKVEEIKQILNEPFGYLKALKPPSWVSVSGGPSLKMNWFSSDYVGLSSGGGSFWKRFFYETQTVELKTTVTGTRNPKGVVDINITEWKTSVDIGPLTISVEPGTATIGGTIKHIDPADPNYYTEDVFALDYGWMSSSWITAQNEVTIDPSSTSDFEVKETRTVEGKVRKIKGTGPVMIIVGSAAFYFGWAAAPAILPFLPKIGEEILRWVR